ncbi:MAG: hypothetical protein KatS3mg060_1282 [Dehalococcoidia bacterium]|nr:MAG: hypothetical protein KatS3mg060_1282 [Dehalococcoidia bacterium]
MMLSTLMCVSTAPVSCLLRRPPWQRTDTLLAYTGRQERRIHHVSATAIRELGLIAACWPLAFGLLLVVVESVRGRAEIGLIGSAVLLGLLFSVIGAIVFDVGETVRRFAAPDWSAVSSAIAADAVVFVGALLTMGLFPWNALPALALAGPALTAAFAHLALMAVGRARRNVLGIGGAVVLLALCGGAAIAGGVLAAIWQAGLAVLSMDGPKPPSP